LAALIVARSRRSFRILRIPGLVLSFHIAGMFAFLPVMGWLTDRLGRRPIIFAGIGVLLTACAVAGSAGHHPARLAAGLMLLGLGWSATMVAGSTLLSESIPVGAARFRPGTFGSSDGIGRRLGRGYFRRDRGRVGVLDSDAACRACDRAADRTCIVVNQS
jgi:MFS family permease